MTIPTIETDRLLLRGYRTEDFDAYAAMWADPVVTRFIGGKPISREASWVRFLRQLGMWQAHGFGFWVVADKATGEFLGEAGFHDLKREIEPSVEGALEAGWGFVPPVYGKGIATEVVGAAVGWADANRPGMRMVCIIDPDNAPSRRVAEKYGFRELSRTTYHGTPTILFQRQR